MEEPGTKPTVHNLYVIAVLSNEPLVDLTCEECEKIKSHHQ